jgi:cation diffusion facilitator CzcD-associated flavoprotein CzcO
MMGLAGLEARLQQDLAYLELPAKNWVPPRQADGRPVLDVAVIGAGMCGLAVCTALINMGVHNIQAFDAAPAGHEGPWVGYARMETLRSPKQLVGPALGMPALTFRAFYEAQFGRAAWDELGKIPRTLWMDYLIWYRQVLNLPVQNDTKMTDVRPFGPDLLELDLTTSAGPIRVLTRRLVLTTGRDGLGGPFVPAMANGIDRAFWAHSADPVDFESLRGKAVGVVGAGASAMDNAASALEAGAARVDLFIRRADLPRINKFTGIGSPGVVHGFAHLPDAEKWRFLHYVFSQQTPPPRDSTRRVSRHDNANFHLGSPILRLVEEGGALQVTTPKGRYGVNFMIFATGFQYDPQQRPEFSSFLPHIRLWQDRFTPPAGQASAELGMFPDLGPAFVFQEKVPGACPMLSRIHCFNHHATLSHGKLAGDIPAVSQGADRLARGLVEALFTEDEEIHYGALQAFATPELLGDEWEDADANAAVSGD